MWNVVKGILLIVFGALAVVSPFMVVGQYRAMRYFLPVQAVVTASEVLQLGQADSRFKARIVFVYQVEGRVYQSARIYPLDSENGPMAGNNTDASRLVERFPVGSTQTAHYDPALPEHCYLLAEAQFFPYMGLLYGASFAAGITEWGVRKLRRARGPGGTEAGPFREPGGVFLGTLVVYVAATAGHYFWLAGSRIDAGAVFILSGAVVVVMVILWKVRRQRASAVG